MALRVDRLLWFLRFAPSRSAAQVLAETGHIRANGQRVTKSAHPVRVGDVLTLPVHGAVRVITITALPDRRGPAAEAARHYSVHDASPLESDSQHSEVIDDTAPADLGDR